MPEPSEPELPAVALSVRQPWAWAIIHGGKDVENRGWKQPNPGLAFRGRVAIHASTTLSRAEYESARAAMARIGVECPDAASLGRGGIVGTVEVVDVVRKSAHAAFASPWFFGPVGLVLRDARPCRFVPAAGALGFFKWQPAGEDYPPAPARWMLAAPLRVGTGPAPPVVVQAASEPDLFEVG